MHYLIVQPGFRSRISDFSYKVWKDFIQPKTAKNCIEILVDQYAALRLTLVEVLYKHKHRLNHRI